MSSPPPEDGARVGGQPALEPASSCKRPDILKQMGAMRVRLLLVGGGRFGEVVAV